MDKKLFFGISFLVVIAVLVFLFFAFWGENSSVSIFEEGRDIVQDGILSAKGEILLDSPTVQKEGILNAVGITGMEIIEISYNGEKTLDSSLKTSGFNATNIFLKTKEGMVEQFINIENNQKIDANLNVSSLVRIDAIKIQWNGTIWILKAAPIRIDNHLENFAGQLRQTDSSIWFGKDFNKQIYFKDWLDRGGYILAYNNGSDSLIEFRLSNIKIIDSFTVDPTFINMSNGFSTTADGCANDVDLWGNESTLFIIDVTDSLIYHYLHNGTFVRSSAAIASGRGLCGNSSTSYQLQLVGNDFYKILWNGTNIGNYNNGAVGNDNVNGLWCNETDMMAVDYSDEIIYQTTRDTGTFVKSFSVAYTVMPQGLFKYNDTDFMMVDQTSQLLYFTDTNLTYIKNYSFATIGAISAWKYGIWGNGTDYWTAAGVGRIFHFFTETIIPPIVKQVNITVNLSSPINHYNSSSSNITFNCSTQITNSSYGMWNLSLIIDSLLNYTVTNTTANQDFLSLEIGRTGITEGSHNWSCLGAGKNSTFVNNSLNRTFTIDLSAPSVTISNVTNIFTDQLPKNSSWWFNATDLTLQQCWYYTSENLTNKTTTCNGQIINYSWSSEGSRTFYACANDSSSRITCNSAPLEVFHYNYTQTDVPDPATEGNSVLYTLRINLNGIGAKFTESNASLSFNNTIYYPTETNFDNYSVFTQSIFMPDGIGNITGKNLIWNWTFNIANTTTILGNSLKTINTNTTVYSVAIDNCTGYTTKILNISLRDEETTDWADENITLEIDVNLSKGNLSWNFYASYDKTNTSVCVPTGLLNNSNYTIDFIIGYDYGSHIREFFYLENGTLSNDLNYFNSHTYKDINLYDLLSADSTTFLFEYTDENNQEVDDIIVHTFRKYIGAGTFREVERSKQDDAGQTHVHLVEEDVIYYFMITQGGTILFTSDTYNAKCLSTPCEIQLSAGATEFNWSIIDNEGGQYSISANSTIRIITVAFNLDQSALVNATVFKFNGTTTIINSTSLTGASGTLRMHIPLAYDNSTFFVAVWNNNEFVKSQWVSLAENARTYFGTFGAILAGFVILTIILMAASEGAALILFTCLAVFISGALMLIQIGWAAMIALICAGAIIMYKLVKRRNIRG